MTFDLTPGRVDLLVNLNSDSNELVLDARTKEKVDRVTVKFDADIIKKAASKNKPIVIKSNEGTVILQTGIWNSVCGKLKDDGTIAAFLPYISKYAVLEKFE